MPFLRLPYIENKTSENIRVKFGWLLPKNPQKHWFSLFQVERIHSSNGSQRVKFGSKGMVEWGVYTAGVEHSRIPRDFDLFESCQDLLTSTVLSAERTIIKAAAPQRATAWNEWADFTGQGCIFEDWLSQFPTIRCSLFSFLGNLNPNSCVLIVSIWLRNDSDRRLGFDFHR